MANTLPCFAPMIYRALVLLIALPITAAFGQTQSTMNARASRNARRADSTLNAVYHQLQRKYGSDSVALHKLRAAEQAWIAFRDAQVAATYPAEDKQQYGSVFPMCASALVEELTRARIAQLRQMLRPTEGDVCVGGPA